MNAIALPHIFSSSSSCCPIRHPSSSLNPICGSSSRIIVGIIRCSSAEVAEVDGIEDLPARERRRLRNERRQQAIESRPPWREVVEEKLSQKVKKPSVSEEMDLKKLAALGLRWWMLDVRKNSERLAARNLQEAFAAHYPDVEFEVFLPATPSTKKLKNGAYSKKIDVLIPGCIFIRCCLTQEIHDFILSSPRVRRFSGKKVGNRTRWKFKPIPVSDLDMEQNFLPYNQGPEKYDSEIKEESLKEEKNETNDDLIGQDLFHDFDVGDFNTDKNANFHANSINDLSNNDVSGKETGSFGIKSEAEKSSKGVSSSIRTDYVDELLLSLKGLKKQDTTKEERKKRKDDSVRQAFVEDVEVGVSIGKNTNSHAHFADESSNIDISGKQVGSSGAKFNSKNLSNTFSDSSFNCVTEPSLKDLDEKHKNNGHDLSNNDVSGKEAGSFGIKSDAEKSSKVFSSSIRTDYVDELLLALKGLKTQDIRKEERKKRKDDSVRQAFVDDVEIGVSTGKNTNSHAHFGNESSNIDISGKKVGSSGAKFNSKNLSNMLTNPSLNYVSEPSLKDLDAQHKNNRHDSELVAGSTVRITSGPFAEFTGNLEEFDLKDGKAKVMIMMFGQETPVDVEINQIEYEF